MIHAVESWRVEHCVGPLGLGTLIVKTTRHVEHLADLWPVEAAELGPLLRDVCSCVAALRGAEQVYVCLWSSGPVHIHFVVQPVSADLVGAVGAQGPKLQSRMFDAGELPDPDEIEAFAEKARRWFGLG